MDLLKEKLKSYGKQLGFPIIRVTSAEPLKIWHQGIQDRKTLDPQSATDWEAMTADPKQIFYEANSIIVAVWLHKPYPQNFPEGIGRHSAHYGEYPLGRAAIKKLAEFLQQQGYEAIVCTNLPAKALAHRAGVGYFGKNGLIHTKDYGSWISLHYILTDAPLLYDEAVDNISDCGSCDICTKACPAGAIGERGIVIPSRCIRYHMLSGDFIPVDMREKMGMNFLGCDICQMVCPKNKHIVDNADLPSKEDVKLFDIAAILEEWPKGLKPRIERMGSLIGNNYARAQRILSMAVILAGNTKEESYIPLLRKTLTHPHPPIRGHSAWALGNIGGSDSLDALNQALKDEKDLRVIEEIERGKENCGWSE